MQIITARVVIVAASLAAAGVCPAYSQGAAPRGPAGGLFGATRSDVGRDKLNFTFHVAEGFDSALPPELNTRVARGLDSGGLSTVLEAQSDYHRGGRRLQLTGNASTAFKHYLSVDRFEPVSHSVFLGADVRVPKGSLKLEQSAAYSPSYLYQLFPTDTSAPLGGAIPTNPEYQIVDTDSYSYRTNAALSFGSAAATRFTTSGSVNRTDVQQQTASTQDLDTAEAGMKIVHNAGPSRRVSAGYDFRVGEFASGGRTEEHSVTLGLAYSPALSRTRRATFSVDLTPSRIDLPASALEGITTDAVDQTLFRFSGEVVAEFPFRPNWRTAARYRRSLEYLSVLNQPVLADGARVELSGLLSRRVDVSASAGYVTAGSALAPSTEPLETYTGQVGVRYAMKRSVALSAEYLYYYYDLAGQTILSPGLPTVFRQQGVRVGAVLFLETLGR